MHPRARARPRIELSTRAMMFSLRDPILEQGIMRRHGAGVAVAATTTLRRLYLQEKIRS